MISIGQLADRPGECVHAAPDGTREMFYRNKACLGHRVPSEEYEAERPLEFQAKCMVLLIEESSRKALLDMLVAAGRILDHPLYAFTTAHVSIPCACLHTHLIGTPSNTDHNTHVAPHLCLQFGQPSI